MKGFEDAVGITIGIEGGYAINPSDRGGPTKLGITQATLDAVRSVVPGLPQAVSDLNAAEATQIYRLAFWNPMCCDSFPWPLSLYLFDADVNHTPKIAAKLLQRALWVEDDGIIGPETKAAAVAISVQEVGYAMLTLRRALYVTLAGSDPSQAVFLKGWLNRIERLKQELEVQA